MPLDEPIFPGEARLNLAAHTLTSNACTSPNLAIDDDPATDAVFASITAEGSGNNPYLYVTYLNIGRIDVIDPASLTIINTVTIPGLDTYGCCLSVDGKTLYAGRATLFALDSSTLATKNSATAAISGMTLTISPDGTRLFGSDGSGNFAVYDPVTLAVLHTQGTDQADTDIGSTVLAISANGTVLGVCDRAGSVAFYDATTYALLSTSSLSNPLGIVLSKDGALAYVTSGNNAVAVVDTSTGAILHTLSDGLNCEDIAISLDGQYVYIVNDGSPYISVLDTATNQFESRIQTGATGADAIAYSLDGTTLFSGSGTTLLAINATDGPVSKTLTLPFTIESIATQAFYAIPPEGRYLRVDWGDGRFVTRVRLNYTGTIYAGVDLESEFGSLEGRAPPGDFPLPYAPLELAAPDDGFTHELILDPPALARGVVFYPDALMAPGTAIYPAVSLYQLQVYATTSPGENNMPNPTVQFARVGCSGLTLYPRVAGLAFPFNAANACVLQAIQSVDFGVSSKLAVVTGGETVHQISGYETERVSKGKFMVQMHDFRAIALFLASTLVVDPADGNGPEVQYLAPNYTDRAPYVTLVALSVNGDPSEQLVMPKIKLSGNLARNLTTSKATDLEVDFELFWDTVYPRQDGQVGGIYENTFTNGGLTNLHS